MTKLRETKDERINGLLRTVAALRAQLTLEAAEDIKQDVSFDPGVQVQANTPEAAAVDKEMYKALLAENSRLMQEMDSGQEERRKSIKMMEEIPSAKDDEDPFLDIKRMQPHEVVGFLSNYLNATQLEGIAPLLENEYVGDVRRLETSVAKLEKGIDAERERAEDAAAEAERLTRTVAKLEKQLSQKGGDRDAEDRAERAEAEAQRLRAALASTEDAARRAETARAEAAARPAGDPDAAARAENAEADAAQLRTHLEEAEGRARARAAERDALQGRVNELTAELADLRRNADAVTYELGEQRRRSTKLEQLLADMQGVQQQDEDAGPTPFITQVDDGQIDSLVASRDKFKKEVQRQGEEIRDLKRKLAEAEAEARSGTEAAARAAEDAETVEKEKTRLEMQVRRLTADLAAASRGDGPSFADLEAARMEAESARVSMEAARERARNAEEQLAAEIEAGGSGMQSALDAALAKAKADAQAAIDAAQRRCNGMAVELDNANDRIRELEALLARAGGRGGRSRVDIGDAMTSALEDSAFADYSAGDSALELIALPLIEHDPADLPADHGRSGPEPLIPTVGVPVQFAAEPRRPRLAPIEPGTLSDVQEKTTLQEETTLSEVRPATAPRQGLMRRTSPNVSRAAKQQRMRTTSATEIRAERRRRADELLDAEPPPSTSSGRFLLPRLPGLQRPDKPGIYL